MSSKRKALTIREKFDIVSRLEKGATNSDVCKDLNLTSSTVSTIWKCREKIKESFLTDNATVKRHRGTQFEDVDDALLLWLKVQRSNNVSVNGPTLLKQAQKYAASLGHASRPDLSWVQRFRKRHNIVFGKISGKSPSAQTESKEEWLKTVWPEIRYGYSDDEVFNADEFGLFYRLYPDKTFKFKGEKCSGGKMSKDRITVMVAANMTGTEKRKLLVIGRSKNPRCFTKVNVKRLCVDYTHNRKAWMTTKVFEKYLSDWDEELRKINKKIILLVDDCAAHCKPEHLKQIKLVFFPANTASILQPMNQGIIKVAKVKFRQLFILQIIKDIEEEKTTTITVLDAIRMISRAWNDVSKTIIKDRFRRAGLQVLNKETFSGMSDDCDADEDINEWARDLSVKQHLQIDNLNEYVSVDDNLAVANERTDDEVLSSVQKDDKEGDLEEDKSDDDEDRPAPVSLSDAFKGLASVRQYLDTHADVPSAVDAAVACIERHLDSVFCAQRKKQVTITSFFPSM